MRQQTQESPKRKRLTKGEARRIAATFAKLPG